MPRTTKMSIKGDFSFTNSDGEADTISVNGIYTISTITHRNQYETVLFREMGQGPRQIELWYGEGHPTPDEVEDYLKAGRFNAR